MNQRTNVAGFFLFVILALIIFLQILSMVQSDRLYVALNKIERIIEGAASKAKSDVEPTASKGEYPGVDGDWLIWAFRVEPKTLNQLNVDHDIYSKWIVFENILEPLMMYDFDDGKLRPLLAESYEMSQDGLEITFHLRDDIHFSDGVPVTADDVVFTYQTITDPNVDTADIASLYVDDDRLEKIDDRTVKFYMKRPYFKALEIVSFWDVGVYPKHIYQFKDAKQFNQRVSDPVGSGPYVFERWDVGRQIVLRRNENYWGPKPRLKKVIYKFVTNPIAAVQALKSHQVDLIIPEPDQFADLVKDKQFNEEFNCLNYWSPGDPFYYIGWNEDTPFFSDARVRLAMTLSINREQIVSELLRGYGQIVTGPFYIKGTQNDASIKPWPYDPEMAKKLLADAGWIDRDGDGIRDKNGVPLRFKFMYSVESDTYTRLASLLKDELAKVSVDIVPDPYEWSVLLPRLTDRQFESMVMGWGGDIVEDQFQILHSSQISNRGSNYVGFKNADADELMEQIRRTIDPNEQDIFCHRLHKIIHEQQPYTFVFTRPTFRAVDKRFQNVNIHKLGLNYLEWYVPKDKQRYK